MRWWKRRRCRDIGHVWDHETEPNYFCNATHSVCRHCGFETYRYWEDSHR